MKILKRMLLIHWFYFVHEMVEFEGINFLTGKNSSGKSTIIDAMQLVLLGDTNNAIFNKAAGGRGTRTLTGYLRGELGDDEGAGFRYLRNGRFTSYIALEFYDDSKKNTFTAGCCFDTFGENDCQKLFFGFDGPIPPHEFVEQNIPFNIESLRSYVRSQYTAGHHYMTGVNRDFREYLCGRLGGLQPKRFSELLKKAVSFNPNVDIQQFITEFVCGEAQSVDITHMQENIRSYDTLKKESALLKERISVLSQIKDAYNDVIRHRESETLYGYLIDRSAWVIKENELEKARQHRQKHLADLTAFREKLAEAETEQKQLQTERDSLKLQLDSNENARRLEEIRKQISEKKQRHLMLKDQFEQASALLYRVIASWKTCVSDISGKISGTDLSVLDPLLRERMAALCAEGEALLERLKACRNADAEGIIQTGAEKLFALSGEADAYRDHCKSLAEHLYDAQNETAGRRMDLKKEKESLEKGIYQFPQSAVDLKEAIESRLRVQHGPGASAVIVAEAAEIRNDRWRNVIEGYMHTQKFYIIVAPEHFYTAFKLFDDIKRRKAIYTTGLVDTEKLQRMNPSRDNGSLAEEVDTDSPSVRLFLDFLLGRVQKCDSIRDLRKHKTSVTDEGVLYQNFVVHAMDPKRWRDPAIGQGGARLRLERVTTELARLEQEISVYAVMLTVLKGANRLSRLSENEAEQIVGAAKAYQELPSLEAAMERLIADAESIDRSEIEILQARFSERENALKNIAEQIIKSAKKIGSTEKALRIFDEETLPAREDEARLLRNKLDAAYPEEWVEKIGSLRYERELATRGTAEEIYRAFPRELSTARNRKEAAERSTRDLRYQYNEAYKMGYDINAPENDVYDRLWQEYSENKLPDYEAKIEDTRKRAFQQFQEDVLSRLQSNIRNARGQINELNATMKDASFGEDRYRFRVIANPEQKRYFDMITDEMLLNGGYNLLSEQFNAKYKEEIDELFTLITSDGAQNMQGYDDYEKRVQFYTDYKTYLSFDLEVIKPNGESERLSKTMGKKSGGETQTPFYIAVLASFAQLYRTDRGNTSDTARLILFDEAFSKMDGERIIQSVTLLRRFNFQVVLAAPPDKIADIATLVDRNLGVLREGHKTCVRAFDPK